MLRRAALHSRHAALGVLLVACGAPPPVVEVPAPKPTAPVAKPAAPRGNPLMLPPNAPQLADPKLRAKLATSPHNYFRSVNLQFARHVCARFKPVMNTVPVVSLHGDPHVEQFAVTERGIGLADYDDSMTGPAVIDLVRFGTSIVLAAKQRGWNGAPLRDAFFKGYRDAIAGAAAPPPPAATARIRKGFAPSREAFLAWAQGRMGETPDPHSKPGEEERGYARYVELMLRMNPDKKASFFRLKAWGDLRGEGLGSATGGRKLYRIEGATPEDGDDLILEAKEVRDMTSVDCVSAPRGNALRVVVGSLRFGHRPDPFLAVIPRGADEDVDDPPWWVQSWTENYAELSIATIASREELAEVVAYVGHQMARGHTNWLPSPYDLQLRTLVTHMWREHEKTIVHAVDELSALAIDAHAKLVASTPR